jgi:hypothetical protein
MENAFFESKRLLENMDEHSIPIFDIIEYQPRDKKKPSTKSNSNGEFRFHGFLVGFVRF